MSGDLNLVSFNGPADSGRTVDFSTQNFDGSCGYNDTLKFSTGLFNFTGRFGLVTSGSEDAVDVNNLCHDLDLSASRWILRGSMGFTIKGGSRNVRLSGPVEGHGRETDVDIGNASDQSHVWVTGTRLNLLSVDRSPIRVRVLGGDLPFLEPGSGPYRFVFPWRWLPLRYVAVKTFLEFRRHGFFVQK